MSYWIADNLWQVGGGDLSHPADAGAYLICLGKKAALVDAGSGAAHQRIKSNIKESLPHGVALEYLLLTHCHFDHTGGAEAIRRDFGCAIVAHAKDAVYLEAGDPEVTAASWYGENPAPLAVDIKLTQPITSLPIGDGQVVAYHWPGHSPGSVVYTTRLDRQLVLFGQDVHGPIHPALLSDESDYQASLQMLLSFGADILLEGHFGVIRGKKKIQDFIRGYIRK